MFAHITLNPSLWAGEQLQVASKVTQHLAGDTRVDHMPAPSREAVFPVLHMFAPKVCATTSAVYSIIVGACTLYPWTSVIVSVLCSLY